MSCDVGFKYRTTYLSTGQNVIWCSSLVSLEILQIHEISLHRTILDRFWKLIFLDTRVRHLTVII